mmetsp:Transcript_22994/g.35459  ORF Transcript_22994/g.35459 Transcript_22994/m.35459 type:complete len:342 (+) Transcript_22994:59-1084(+)
MIPRLVIVALYSAAVYHYDGALAFSITRNSRRTDGFGLPARNYIKNQHRFQRQLLLHMGKKADDKGDSKDEENLISRVTRRFKKDDERKPAEKTATNNEKPDLLKTVFEITKLNKQQNKPEKKIKENAKEKNSPLDAIAKRIPIINNSDKNKSDDKKGKKFDKSSEENQSPIGALSNAATNALSSVQSATQSVTQSVFGKPEEWVAVCPKTRIAPGEAVPVVAAGLDLLLYASRDGRKLYCVPNQCSHLGTPLETGIIQKMKENSDGVALPNNNGCECVVCPLHRTAFNLENGEVVGEWCPYPPLLGKAMGEVKKKNKLATFATRIKGKNIEVRINSALNE